MKKTIMILALAIVALVGSQAASAQLRFGIKGGVALNKMEFDKSSLESDNRAGFTGGIMLEFNLPVVGLGFDASAMYTHRSAKYSAGNAELTTLKRDYIAFPINLKYKFSILPMVKPFAFTGPEFGIRLSDEADGAKYSRMSTSWNVGAGVELLNHLQIAASYGIGLNKTVQDALGISNIDGKDKYWTITAAYLF